MSLKDTALSMGFQALDTDTYTGTVYNIHQEIRLIKAIINEYKIKPLFRQLATKIINSFPCQHKNYDCYAYAIARWVRNNIKYIKDVSGYETLQTPDRTLQIGGGDCDDHAILLATLFESIGMKTTLKIVGKDGRYRHIYVIVTTPEGRKWAVDTTEKEFFKDYSIDEVYEMEILEDLQGLEELGWGIKIKFKPKKFFKRATGGIRHPKKFVKQLKRKPLTFINKRFREVVPKPIKASTRAFSPVIKPIKRLEKINPIKIKGFKPIKALKRATASKSIDEAVVKTVGALLAAKTAVPAVSSAASTMYSFVPNMMNPAVSTAADFLNLINTASYVADKGRQAQVIPSQVITVPQYQPSPQTIHQQVEEKKLYKDPLVVAAGILAVGLLLRR